MVSLRFIRKGLYHENSTNSSVRLPYNHGKKSWDKFVLVTLFLHTHTHTPTPPPPSHTHTHTPSKQSLANEPRLAQPLPRTYNVGHSTPTHVGKGSIACSNFSCKIYTLEIRVSQTLLKLSVPLKLNLLDGVGDIY